MKTKHLFAVIAVSFLAISCTSSPNHDAKSSDNLTDTTFQDSVHTSESALDWEGTYEGVLPCADCEGLRTIIELKADHTFKKSEEYLGKKEKFTSNGRVIWMDNGRTIVLKTSDGESHNYQVREGALVMLNSDGSEITGDLAKNYIFDKK